MKKMLALGMLGLWAMGAQAQNATGALAWQPPKVVVAGQTATAPVDLPKLMADQVTPANAIAVAEVPTIRAEALQEAAASLGARAGLARKLHEIATALERQTMVLDKTYNFMSVALSVPMNPNEPATEPDPAKNGEYAMVLPPVILEGRDSDALNGDDEMRIADRTYRIFSRARLVPVDKKTGKPAVSNWRDYLIFSFQEVQMPHPSMLPKNDAEKTIWNEWIQKGWRDGEEQGVQMFEAGLARLNRDFKGMLNYRLAFAQGLVSRPMVAGVNMGVTGGGQEMRVNDRVVRITDHSSLIPEPAHWLRKTPY